MSARDTSYEKSLLQRLTYPNEAAAYVEAALELDDPAVLKLALQQVEKANRMAALARDAKMGSPNNDE